VDVDIVLTERVVDLIEEGFDLAIRIGELSDSTLLARKIGALDLHLYASPDFLQKHGEPKTGVELAKFECIRFTSAEDPDEWSLKGPRGGTSIHVVGRVSSNNMELVREFAVSGNGIALMPHFYCAEDVEAGRLRVVLPNWVQEAGPIHVVYPGHRLLLPKVRSFVDHLVHSCSEIEWKVRKR
jgi:DNA-binding transcriptional LysR family regulator